MIRSAAQALFFLATLMLSAIARGDDGLELVDGLKVDGQVVLENHAGSVILRSTRTWMAQSFPRDQVHAITRNGKRSELNPKRAVTEKDKRYRESLIWPELIEQEPKPAYTKQTWQKRRLLIWARPGEGGMLWEPKNWIEEDGTPSKTLMDPYKTDLLFPACEKNYAAGVRYIYTISPIEHRPPPEWRGIARHITVERGAIVNGLQKLTGNGWVKTGGWGKITDFVGYKHTFFRLENGEYLQRNAELNARINALKKKLPGAELLKSDPVVKKSRTYIAHAVGVAKGYGASHEFVGNMYNSDRFVVATGKCVFGPGSSFRTGSRGNGHFDVFTGGTLEFQSGSRAGAWRGGTVYIWPGGTLQAGSPQRPITKDATLLIHTVPKRSGEHPGIVQQRRGGAIRVFSADPRKARLVVAPTTSIADWPDVYNPDEKGSDGHGVGLNLGGITEFNGVMLDYVRKGGIRFLDPSNRKEWQNVFFGTHNAGPPAELFGPDLNPDECKPNRKSPKHREKLPPLAGGVTFTAEQKRILAEAESAAAKSDSPTAKAWIMNTAREKVRATFSDKQEAQAENY